MFDQEGEKTSKKRILVFCDYYLPSIKSGGGMWTVVNLVERFCNRYDFFVVTRNHESRNDTTPFSNVVTGAWNRVGNAEVFYIPGKDFTVSKVTSLVKEVGPDGVFLNSVFSKPSVMFLLARRLRRFRNMPIVLAVCGELSPEVLRIKAWKKRPYLLLGRMFGLFKRINWKASSPSESSEIRAAVGTVSEPFVAPDLPPLDILPNFSVSDKPAKEPGQAKLIFYSRIARKKNLTYLLDRLAEVADSNIELTIAGPVEDVNCWNESQQRIDRLPENIKVIVLGAVSYENGLELLTQNQVFILPTIYENFGYVILEALAAGCPVMISDRTIWTSLIEDGAGWATPLDQSREWTVSLEQFAKMAQAEYTIMSTSARKIAEGWLKRPENDAATAAVLENAFGS